MAQAKKLPSGSWRVLVYSYTETINGKKKNIYESFTADTKSGAEYLAAEFRLTKKKKPKPKNITVGEAIDNYINSKDGVLSPTTTRDYKKIRRFAFADLMDAKMSDITKELLQNAVNKETKRIGRRKKQISAKTVKNEYGLLSAALAVHDIKFNITLPKKHKKIIELPPTEQVMSAIVGSSIELPCFLAIWLSFSMSEIRGIKCSSIIDDQIFINQVLIDVDGKPYEKENGKIEKRLRKHRIPPYIKFLIEQEPSYKDYIKNGNDGYLISLNRNQLYDRLQKLLKAKSIQLSFHKLRHLNASVMLRLKVPDKYAMERGGWKTPHTMQTVYQHTFSDERINIDNQIDEYFDKIIVGINKNTTQNTTRKLRTCKNRRLRR